MGEPSDSKQKSDELREKILSWFVPSPNWRDSPAAQAFLKQLESRKDLPFDPERLAKARNKLLKKRAEFYGGGSPVTSKGFYESTPGDLSAGTAKIDSSQQGWSEPTLVKAEKTDDKHPPERGGPSTAL